MSEFLLADVNGQVNWLTERLETVGIIAAPLSGESSKDDRAEIMRRLQVGDDVNRVPVCWVFGVPTGVRTGDRRRKGQSYRKPSHEMGCPHEIVIRESNH